MSAFVEVLLLFQFFSWNPNLWGMGKNKFPWKKRKKMVHLLIKLNCFPIIYHFFINGPWAFNLMEISHMQGMWLLRGANMSNYACQSLATFSANPLTPAALSKHLYAPIYSLKSTQAPYTRMQYTQQIQIPNDNLCHSLKLFLPQTIHLKNPT